MTRSRILKLIQQRTVISNKYLFFLAVLSVTVLTGGVVAVVNLSGWQRMLTAVSCIGMLALIHQIGTLLFTCVDQSEFQIRGLRQKLFIAAQKNSGMPEPVQQSIRHLAHRRHSTMTYAAAQRDVALNNIVARIIDGNFDSLEQINQALKPYALSLQGKAYVLSLFHTLEIPDDAFDLNVENSLRAFGYPNPLAAFFRTIIGEMYGTAFPCLISESNGVFRCIITTDAPDCVATLEQEVLDISTRIIQVFKTCLSITMLGAVSQMQEDFGRICASCDELNRLMECRSFIGDARTVLTHADLDVPAQHSQQYQHSLRRQQALISLLETQEFQTAREACTEMLQESSLSDTGGFLLSKLLISSTAYACMFSQPMVPDDFQRLSEQLQSAKSVQEYAAFFEALISQLEAKSVNTEPPSWTIAMANYIDEHYAERDLTVSSVSDLFHYNPIYATKVFKQETGLNISAYIQQKRLNRARQLLGDGHTVKEIANACGFSNAACMNRAFVKEFGVTPGTLNEKPKKKQEP